MDSHLRVVLHRPIPGSRGSAPQSNIRLPQTMRRFDHQRPVVDQDSLPAHRLEPVFGVFNALRAPLFDVDVGGDRQLIVKLDPGLCDCLLRCQPQGTEAVIIERKQRADGHIAKDWVWIFRGQNPNRAQLTHQGPVARLAANALSRTVKQLMVARHPDHLGETLGQRFQRIDHIGNTLSNITGNDQPITRIAGSEVINYRLVLFERNVQIANCPQSACHRLRLSHPSSRRGA